jgi:integrase
MSLTNLACRHAKADGKPIKLADDKGLYLLVNSSGRYWRWDYRFGHKRKTVALGVYPEVGLAQARDDRDAARKLLASGTDPMAARKIDKLLRITAAGNSFKAVAVEWHTGQSVRWAPITAIKALKHMEADLFPLIGHRVVSEVTPPELLAALRRVQSRGATYTATRLREICGQVFRYAIATGRATYNPAADLRGAIVLPRVQHRPAITERRPFGQFPRDLTAFQGADDLTKIATRLALLTFVRSQELRFAKWEEVDIEAREWRIPSGRMKMAKGSSQAHVVPLSAATLRTLAELRELTGWSTSLFPNNYGGDGFMSENTIGRMLIRMGYQHRQTLHGFRASARSLLSERGWSIGALERQLDHSERSKVIAAYARSEHLEERRRMMDDWGTLVDALEAGENVVPLSHAA